MSDPMAPFRVRFVARAREELPRLTAAKADPAADTEVPMIVHRMAGLAGTVGYGEISRLAGLLDEAFNNARPIPAAAYAELLDALEALAAAG